MGNLIKSVSRSWERFRIGENNFIDEGCKIGPRVRIGCNNVIGKRVALGPDVIIRNNSVIEDDCSIGEGTEIENMVEIMEGTSIGKGVTVRSFTRIGPRNVIEDGVTVKCSAITGPVTTIKKDAFIGPQVICTSKVGGHKETRTVIGERAFIGAGTKVLAEVVIANDVIVGGLCLVTEDLTEAGGTYVGIPARLK